SRQVLRVRTLLPSVHERRDLCRTRSLSLLARLSGIALRGWCPHFAFGSGLVCSNPILLHRAESAVRSVSTAANASKRTCASVGEDTTEPGCSACAGVDATDTRR